jgi:N6-adenosine-specific RNA methylase IME4
MMPALRLFEAPAPPSVSGIDLRCCGVAELLAEVRGARLIHADPPWRYAREAGMANPQTHGIYAGLSELEIVVHLDAAFACAAPASRLVCWYTWPKDAEWRRAGHAGPRWNERVTGGAWTKMQATATGARKVTSPGVGYHWRGETEPVALFTRGACGRAATVLSNGHVSPNGEHSEKPLPWLREWLRAWTAPGDLVLDLYAGLAPMARACAIEGRRYVGAEIDPERHAKALGLLALSQDRQ